MSDGLEPPCDDGSDRPAPLPPDDRLWRHPSEIGRGAAAASEGSGPAMGATSRGAVATRRMPLGALLAAGVGMGVFVVGTFVVAGWLTTEREGDVASARTVHDVVYLASSTTASATIDTARPGWLGISAVDVPRQRGVRVTVCDPGSPAESTLRPRDVILSLDGTATPTMAELVVVLAGARPGHRASIRLVRDGAAMVVPVVLGRQP